jgi:hypothetical protein
VTEAKTKKIKGRPKRTGPPTNVSQLARDLGVGLEALRTHIRKGVSIPVGDVEQWRAYFMANGRAGTQMSFLPAEAKKKAEFTALTAEQDFRRKKRENDEADGLLAPKGEVRSGLNGIVAVLFGELRRRLCSELPPLLATLSAVEIRERMEKECEEMETEVRRQFDELHKKATQKNL